MIQHYILPNADGSGIQIMQVIAQRIVFTDDGATFPVRLNDSKMLVGYPSEGVARAYAADFTAGNYVLEYPTPEECVAKWPADHPQPVNVAAKRRIQPSDIPTDRTFRGAWKDTGTKIDVHMPTARNMWRDCMRTARGAQLAALDAAYMKADEDGNAQLKRTIATQKQQLRDVTALPDIEAASTPEALKAVWPAYLGARLVGN